MGVTKDFHPSLEGRVDGEGGLIWLVAPINIKVPLGAKKLENQARRNLGNKANAIARFNGCL